MPEPSLVADLGSLVDDLRGLATEFGIRPYRVFFCRTKWSGGQRGEGVETLLSRTEILPRPIVQDVADIVRKSGNAGLQEIGDLHIREISYVEFTEDELMGRTANDGSQPADESFFWGIIEENDLRVNPSPIQARRFFPSRVAHLDSGQGLEWRVWLKRQDVDVARPEVWQP